MLTTSLASSTSPSSSCISDPSPSRVEPRSKGTLSCGMSKRNEMIRPVSGAHYVYPKLQLVQIEDSWYALNQTCLQIYQQLQMCGTADLMPVDVVPIHKLPDCVRKSLSISGNSSGGSSNNSGQLQSRKDEINQQTPSRSGVQPPSGGAQHPLPDKNSSSSGSRENDGGSHQYHPAQSIFRIYDDFIMSGRAGAASSSDPTSSRTHPSGGTTTTEDTKTSSASSPGLNNWWSRFLFLQPPPPSSSAGNRPPPPQPTRPKKRQQSHHRRRHEDIVRKLLTELNLREPITSNTTSSYSERLKRVALISNDPDSEGSCYICVVCQSGYPNRRLLQRHRDRANHFGCPVCCKAFANSSSLQDHCERMDHWSEAEDYSSDDGDDGLDLLDGEMNDDDEDLLDYEEDGSNSDFFSSENSDDANNWIRKNKWLSTPSSDNIK